MAREERGKAGVLTDVAHTLLGFTAGLLGPVAAVPLTIVYVAYQVVGALTRESPRETMRDIAEYAAGLVVGLVVRHLLAWVLGL